MKKNLKLQISGDLRGYEECEEQILRTLAKFLVFLDFHFSKHHLNTPKV